MSEKELMKVAGFYKGLPIDDPKSFIDEKEQISVPSSWDLLVKANAVSVNPVDTKFRQDNETRNALRILGFGGVGKVVAVGDEVQKFSVGDRVFHAGTTTRAGSSQEYQLVDGRTVALVPKNPSDEEAAALSLTSLTVYELLPEKFGLTPEEDTNHGKKILVVNGSGGVGSILSQLVHWVGLEVYVIVGSKSFEWPKKIGVDYPTDYHHDLGKSLRELGIDQVEYVVILFDIIRHFDQIGHLVRPFGHVGMIAGTKEPLDIGVWKSQSISSDRGYMFAKTDYNYEIETQGEVLAHIAALVDEGIIRSILSKVYSDGMNAKNLRQATKDVETGHTLGKIVVSGPFNG